MTAGRGNVFAGIPDALDAELTERLAVGVGARVERIVSRGHASPDGFWYDQNENEWVLLLSGQAAIRFEGDDADVILRPGDHVEIPAHARHRVQWTSPDEDTVWLAVFYEAGEAG